MWKDLSKAIAQALYDIGKGHSPEPTEFTPEELEQRFGVSILFASTVAVMRLDSSSSPAGSAVTLDPPLNVRSPRAGILSWGLRRCWPTSKMKLITSLLRVTVTTRWLDMYHILNQ